MKYLLLVCIIVGVLEINGTLFKTRSHSKNKIRGEAMMTTVTQAEELFDIKKEAHCATNQLGMFQFKLKSFGKITLDAFNRKVADNQAAWCFDALDPLMSKLFGEDQEKVWKFFHGQSNEGINPMFSLGESSPLPEARQKAMVSYLQYKNGLASSGLLLTLKGKTPKEAFTDFDFNGDFFFNYQELILFMISQTAKSLIPLKCNNCFEESRKQLRKLFDYMDCDKNQKIDSEDMWLGWKEMKSFLLFTTASTNDLELKSDNNNDAMLSPQEFLDGVLHGYWERQTGPDGPSTEYLVLKKVREKNYEARKKKAEAEGKPLSF